MHNKLLKVWIGDKFDVKIWHVQIHQTLDERLVAAQQEIAAAEKEKIEKEAAARTLLDEQEKMMNSIVEESRKLQKEAEDNLKVLSASFIIWFR